MLPPSIEVAELVALRDLPVSEMLKRTPAECGGKQREMNVAARISASSTARCMTSYLTVILATCMMFEYHVGVTTLEDC